MVEESPPRRELLVSKGWVQASIVVFLLGFFVLGLLAYRTYSADPPIPDRIVDPQGQTLFTGEDISEGQKVFLNNGLMEYGSIFGHGAYLGPDWTADYLHRAGAVGRAPVRRRGLGPRPRADDRRLPGEPLRRARRTPSLTPSRRPMHSRSSSATTPTTSRIRRRSRACDPTRSTTQRRRTSSRRSSAGLRGRPPHAGRGTTTPTRTTGRLRSSSTTVRPRTWSSGASSR